MNWKLPWMGISVTPKVHIVMSHVGEYCQRKGKGLGCFNEQPGEAVHHDFGLTWKDYKRDLDNPQYPGNLLQGVVNYNSFHI